ncbi:MAG: glycosyltransferase [Rhodospirillales bacterium]|nr:MAG: glycosyltransferase [Rhodospirillales bacterium]
MSVQPKISIVMAVRDGAAHLYETLASLQAQTLHDFELIVIDDGSKDETPALLDGWQDRRMVRLRNPEPLGLAAALNQGIGLARGEYIARQDADDLARPERLAVQAAFLDAHPDLVLLGSAYDVIGPGGDLLETQCQPEEDRDIRWQMLFHNAFCHSSAMLRRDMLNKNDLLYDTKLAYAQDYDLWSRLLHFGKGANLAEPLIALRLHEASMSAKAKPLQQETANQIAASKIESLLGAPQNMDSIRLLRSWYYGLPDSLPKEGAQALRLMLRLLRVLASQAERAKWAERILRHPDAAWTSLAPLLISLAPVASLRALALRFLGRTVSLQKRVRPA